ncbi:hypothetical protein [Microbulbifer variabilis]|uniref:hypothetical protein n=1 Tax=Microbulbifer variabilis TaxID=266805 RepID=UPI00035E24A4|nr:hypothetical protein [Microbulbifer variabilis]
MKKISFLIFSTLLTISTQASAKNTLESGTWLQSGEKLVSANGKFELIMQTPGNLVLYENRTNSKGDSWRNVLWATHTGGNPGNPGAKAFLQKSNGLFIVYSKDMKPLWRSDTANNANKNGKLLLMDTGNLVLLREDGTPFWHTGTGPKQCKTETIDLWGGSYEQGKLQRSENECWVHTPRVPSPAALYLPVNWSSEFCVVYPGYAGKLPHTTCD